MPFQYKNVTPKKIYYNNKEVKELYYKNVKVWGANPLDGTLAIGNLVTFDGKSWRVVGYDSKNKYWYLGYETIAQLTAYGASQYYLTSTIAKLCTAWMNTNISSYAQTFLINITIEEVTNKVFIPTLSQINNSFSYYNDPIHLNGYYNNTLYDWWLSSSASGQYAHKVISASGGAITGSADKSGKFGFRPHICIVSP